MSNFKIQISCKLVKKNIAELHTVKCYVHQPFQTYFKGEFEFLYPFYFTSMNTIHHMNYNLKL